MVKFHDAARWVLAAVFFLTVGQVDRAGADIGPPPDLSTAPPAAPAPPSGGVVKWGADIYLGLSSLAEHRLFADGLWAGTRPWTPSTTYLSWENEHGFAGKLSIGLGEVFNGGDAEYDQPAEAWIKVPVGPISVTGGKYWIPFAGMEWEYETRYGVLMEWADRRHAVSLSVNPNDRTRVVNTYTRVQRSLGGENALGLSLGTGKGFSYGSPHSLGWGVDGSFTRRAWTLRGEHLLFAKDRSRSFDFTSLNLSHAGPGRLTPSLSWYSWNDDGRDFGSFHSIVPGTQYQLNATLSVEAAWALTSDQKLGWLQLHYSYE